MNKNSKIYVAGHTGMVGSSIVRNLIKNGYLNLILKSHSELDLTRQNLVESFFAEEKPDYVFLAAAKVGGIEANRTYITEFLYQNLLINMNIINSAYNNGCKKIEFLGSSCIYPKNAKQPINEDCFLKGDLEETNEAYSIAKIAGIKYCEYLKKQYGFNSIALMPTNAYGYGDSFDENSAHVIPSLIRKFHNAKIKSMNDVVCWGDGSPLREFLYVDDLADACVYLMNNYDDAAIINVGTGIEISIKDLTVLISNIVGYRGNIIWDKTKPNGMSRKLLDSSKINKLDWKPKTSLENGIKYTYDYYLSRLC